MTCTYVLPKAYCLKGHYLKNDAIDLVSQLLQILIYTRTMESPKPVFIHDSNFIETLYLNTIRFRPMS